MSAQDLLHELGLNGPVTFGPGRKAQPLRATYAGELTVEDLIAARAKEGQQTATPVGELRQSHHTLARVLAQGTKGVEASAITGYSQVRISTLKNDPAFQELLAYYEAMEAEQYSVARADMHERLAVVGFDSLEVLHSRLLDNPEQFTVKDLRQIVEATADRTGYGKTSTVNHDVTHSLSEASLARVKEAALAGSREVSEGDRGALLRLAAARTAPELCKGGEVIEAEWSEVGGSAVREAGEEDPGDAVAGGDQLAQVDPLPGS